MRTCATISGVICQFSSTFGTLISTASRFWPSFCTVIATISSRCAIAYSLAWRCTDTICRTSAGRPATVSAWAPSTMFKLPIAVPYGYSSTRPTPAATDTAGPGSAPT